MGRLPKLKLLSFLVLLLLLLLAPSAITEEMSCCSSASGSCRSVCSKLSMVSLGADSNARLNGTRILSEFCSTEMMEFWDCINTTFKDMDQNEKWTGRSCCEFARGLNCRLGCTRAGKRQELRDVCRWSDEPEFAECLEIRERADECCGSVTNVTCRAICTELFHRPGKQAAALKLYGSKGCFHQVPKCLKIAAESKVSEDPKLYLHCCEHAPSSGCLDICRRALRTLGSIHEVLDALEDGCGPVAPHSGLWSCLLKSAPTKPQRLPLNIGKLACCSQASRRICQNLCWRAFQTDWSAWQQLEATCLVSSSESELRRCLDDTEDACEMGCSGLSFCSHFNNRPTTLFRCCSTAADELAKWEADHWLRGGIIGGLGAPVRAAPNCPSATLRVAACLLQLRPCEPQVHETRLCREDCMELVTSCVDWSAVNGHNATTLCAKLSPPKSDMPCVSIKPFLEEAPERKEPSPLIEEDINMPCKSNPCPQGQICSLRLEERRGYHCTPGCTLGEMSRQLIPVGAWAQIPRFEHQGCYRLCQCSISGKLDKCRDLNCLALNTCWVQNSFVTHRSSFYLECNSCRCFEGEISCSRKSCTEVRVPSLPCDCPDHYVPVCSKFGLSYASACLAKCAGLLPKEVEYNSCSSKDPCASKPCQSGERCVHRPRVCLSPIQRPCEQHECIPPKCEHREDIHDGPVCDSENRQQPSLCSLLRSGSVLAYRGSCLRGCSLRGPVCGINGETYTSECAAWAERTIADYLGACIAVGLIGEESKARCGPTVTCPPLVKSSCLGVTPPGACCPICGGAARLFYSKKQLDRIYYQLTNEADKRIVTLEAMLEALARQLQVAECVIMGMLTPDGDIFVVNQPTSKKPSNLQLSACVAEIEKLVSRIAERSPRIVAEVPLSSLTRAEVAHTRLQASEVPVLKPLSLIFHILLLLHIL